MGTELATELLEESGTDDLIEKFAASIGERGREFAMPRLPMAAERLAIERRIARLRADVTPASANRESLKAALMVIADLFTRYPSMRNDEAAMRCSAYLDDLQVFPVFAIRAACEDVKRGRLKGVSPEFPPTSPRLYEAAERHAAVVRARIGTAERVLRVRVELPRPASPEKAQQVARQLAALAEEFAAKQKALREDLRERNRKAIRDMPGPGPLREYLPSEHPVYAAPGIPISPTLANQVAQWIRRDEELRKTKPKDPTVL